MGTDGTYALTNLPTGDYVVEFYAVGYMSEYYNNVTSSVSATTVHVTAGATTAGIDAVLTAGIASVPNPATVSGRVVDLDGNGLGGVTVLAPLAGSATTTAPDGSYSLTVTTSDSQLKFTRDGYVTENVGIFPGTTTVDNPYVVPDVRLSRIVTISGTVTAGIDGPLAHAQVSIYTPLGLVATALKDANGAYTVTNLRENNYAISAESINDQAYATAFYGGASVSSLAKYVSAPEGSTLSTTSSTSTSPNGATIAGATRATYAPVAADLGARLSVKVTGVKQGYVSATVTSAQTAAVQLQRVAVVAGTVTISGTPLVTMTLTAQPGTWSPSYVRLAYQWLRDGVAIAGETGSTYTVGMADIGHRLTVSVTGSRPGSRWRMSAMSCLSR